MSGETQKALALARQMRLLPFKHGQDVATTIEALAKRVQELESQSAASAGELIERLVRQRVDGLKLLGAEINSINAANGWDVCTPADWPASDKSDEIAKVRKLGTVIALIHSEASEALEALRKRDRENFEEELADVLIRVLDVSCGLGIDIDAVVKAKLAKNRTRGLRHGGKAV